MSNFNSIKRELSPLLQQAEKTRKMYRASMMVNSFLLQFILLLGILIPMFIVLFNTKFTIWLNGIQTKDLLLYSPQLYMLLFWGLFFLFMILTNSVKRKYHSNEKAILKAFMAKVAPTFKYEEQKQISAQQIIDSELISTASLPLPNGKYKNSIYNLSQGTLSGKVGETALTMGAVKTLSRSPNSFLMYIPLLNYLNLTFNYIRPCFSKKHTFEKVGSSFLGMFAIIEFNKRFYGTTVVLPDQFEKNIGYLAKTLQSLNFGRNQLVNLENIEFEKEFVVYSSDQVEARYILSPLLMERITRLKRKVGKPIMLSFKNNTLFMGVHHPYGFLKLDESKNLITSNALELLYEDILTAINIVEDLDLNTKIWKIDTATKEI